MTTGFLVFLFLVALYLGGLLWLVRSGRMAKWNLSLLMGVVLMVRTQRGKQLIDFIARPKRFWNFFADLGTILTLSGMAVMTVLFAWVSWISIQPHSPVQPLGASEILVIPGVNPFVPLWYGLIALIVTLVVHEGGHGVLARANGMKLKSLGLLFAVVPVGAFVEPEELDLKVASRRNRLRVFSAGPAVNLTFAAITLILFSSMVGAATPVPGVHVAAVIAHSPAADAHLAAGDSIMALDSKEVRTWSQFRAFMNGTHPGQTVVVRLETGATRSAVLATRWSSLSSSDQQNLTASDPKLAESLQKQAFLGVQPLAEEDSRFLAHPFTSGTVGALRFISLPIGEVRGEPFLSTYMPSFYEAPFAPAAYWILATGLFWIFWLNLMVGLTNILPMIPLDGGHIFRDAVGAVVQRFRPAMPVERRDRVVSLTATVMSFIILGAFLVQILGPRIVQAFT